MPPCAEHQSRYIGGHTAALHDCEASLLLLDELCDLVECPFVRKFDASADYCPVRIALDIGVDSLAQAFGQYDVGVVKSLFGSVKPLALNVVVDLAREKYPPGQGAEQCDDQIFSHKNAQTKFTDSQGTAIPTRCDK